MRTVGDTFTNYQGKLLRVIGRQTLRVDVDKVRRTFYCYTIDGRDQGWVNENMLEDLLVLGQFEFKSNKQEGRRNAAKNP